MFEFFKYEENMRKSVNFNGECGTWSYSQLEWFDQRPKLRTTLPPTYSCRGKLDWRLGPATVEAKNLPATSGLASGSAA